MNVTETDKNSELVGILPAEHPYANIVWQVSDVCNYRCSYCNPGNWGGKSPNVDLETYKKVLGQIIDNFHGRGYKAFKFFFSGGEPTIWPPLIPIIQFIRERVERPVIAVNTNVSRSLDWWKKNGDLFHDVVASFHVETAKPDHYLAVVEHLQYRVSYLSLRMLMHDARFQEVVDFAERLKGRLKNYTLEYAPLLQEMLPQSDDHFYQEAWKRDFLATNTYVHRRDAYFELIDRPLATGSEELYADGSRLVLNSNRVVAQHQNQFQGWKCWIGDNIFIGPQGRITLASCGLGGEVGNMNQGTIRFFNEPAICPFSRCNCGTDLCIPKISPKVEQALAQRRANMVRANGP